MPNIRFKSVEEFILCRNAKLVEISKDLQSILIGSPALIALGDKITHMLINIGCPQSVLPMLNRMILKGPKHWSQGAPGCDPTPLGIGHFRWDWKVYTLSEKELKTVVKAYRYIKG